MPKQRIYSVHQRSTADPALERELAVFTDDMMADNAINSLYRYAWNVIVKNTASPVWFSAATREEILAQGFDTWAINNKNSLTPVFFKRPHDLWNQVPPNFANSSFTEYVIDNGVVPIEEVKKRF